jgi:uncharacterized protein (TIGR02996 family)
VSLGPLKTSLLAGPEVLGLLQAVVESPQDRTPRLVLADWLEERGDARAALLRLVPALEETPRHEGPRSDLPFRVWRDRRTGLPRSSTRGWPCLPHALPPRPNQPWGKRARWRGLHHLGRLLGAAMVREVLALPDQDEAVTVPLRALLARWELYACGLIDARERDLDGRMSKQLSFLAWLPPLAQVTLDAQLFRAAWRCRAGPFSGYISVAGELFAYHGRSLPQPAPGSYDDVEAWLSERLRRRAPLYGRFLDLARAFAHLAPWQEARTAWEMRGR